MRRTIFMVLTLLFACYGTTFAQNTESNVLAGFNHKFIEAHQKMDTAVVMSMWADDGVSLLPGTAPIIGKPSIEKFINDAMARMQGYKTISHDLDFRDIQVSGDWASEWAITKQVVQPPDNKPRMTIVGKMLLVLHREKDGWKIKQECWTPSPSS